MILRLLLVLALLPVGLLTAGLVSGRVSALPPAELKDAPRARLSCKAVKNPDETAGCTSIEFDLTATKDGVLVLSHDPLYRGRSIPESLYAELPPELMTLAQFVAGLKARKSSFDVVDLDMKDRDVFSFGRMTSVLEKNRADVEAIASLSRHTVLSSPVSLKYSEINHFIARAGLAQRGVFPSLEIIDYTSEQAARWGLPMKPVEALFLPLARVWSRVYYAAYANRIPFLVMQEPTAGGWKAEPGARILCWTRDAARPSVPDQCYVSERARASGNG